jgi:threonine efflux protein
MELTASLLQLSVIHLLMAMVGHVAASRSRRAGVLAALGVMTASVAWVSLSLAGVGVLMLEAGVAYTAVRVLGACYILYVGLRMLRGRAPASGDGGRGPAGRRRSPYLSGILTTLANPKSAVFWTSVFALVLPGQAPAWFYLAVAGLIAAQSAAWYGLVALAFSTGPARRGYQRLSAWLDRIAGGVMILLGAKLANDLGRELAARAL